MIRQWTKGCRAPSLHLLAPSLTLHHGKVLGSTCLLLDTRAVKPTAEEEQMERFGWAGLLVVTMEVVTVPPFPRDLDAANSTGCSLGGVEQ